MNIAIKCFHDRYSCESILILGDMLELGKYNKQGHEEIITLAKSLSFNRIITVGENFKKTSANFSNPDKFSSTSDLIDHIKKNPIKNKNIFIKGSRSFSLEKILDFI
jgi:UDP-N-acetylmuramoyl-tripeptide--D-alanyl-D-alanine ligase